jgi:hypothetical protein
MGYNDKKKPLYRTVNTRVPHMGLYHDFGSDAKYDRNTKEGVSKTMKNKKKRGLDFTPLYMFLLSKVGQKWDDVYSEAKSRIPESETEAIEHMFHKPSIYFENNGYSLMGESTMFSKLMVDENGLLQKTHPELTIEQLYPTCDCCTHTFNGKTLTNKWRDNPIYKELSKDGIPR